MGSVRLLASLKWHQSNVTQNISGFLGHSLCCKAKTLRSYCSVVLVTFRKLTSVESRDTICEMACKLRWDRTCMWCHELRIYLKKEREKLGALEVQKEIRFDFLEDFCRSHRSNFKYFNVTFPYITGVQYLGMRPASWSSGQSFWLLITRSRVRFPALPWEFSL